MFGKDTYLLTQSYFRIMMNSMSHPGKSYSLPDIKIANQDIKYNSSSAVCYTLLDHEVKFSIIGPGTHDFLIEQIFQLTKSPYVEIEQAGYVIVAGGSSKGSLIHLNCGSPDFPDSGATVIYLAKEINHFSGLKITLRGPGINNEISFKISGVDRDDLRIIKNLNSEFPLGIDTIFIDETNMMLSLPRSSQIFMED